MRRLRAKTCRRVPHVCQCLPEDCKSGSDRKKRKRVAGTTGLEPATSDVTGRRSNQLNYVPEV